MKRKFVVLCLICIGLLTGAPGQAWATDGPTMPPDYTPMILETPGPEPEHTPASTPVPTEQPAPTPGQQPTAEPSQQPSPIPSNQPVATPTQELLPSPLPANEPTPLPTEEPTEEPAPTPTPEPTKEPATVPPSSKAPSPTPASTESPGDDANGQANGPAPDSSPEAQNGFDLTKFMILFLIIILLAVFGISFFRDYQIKKRKSARKATEPIGRKPKNETLYRSGPKSASAAAETDTTDTSGYTPSMSTGRHKAIPYNIRTAASMHQGTRDIQQDALYVSESVYTGTEDSMILGVLGDGMGGMRGGEMASRKAVEQIKTDFIRYMQSVLDDTPAFLRQEMFMTDQMIYNLAETKYAASGAMGTTLAAVIIRQNLLFWASVGDSRIYILRGREMLQMTRDHNYMLQLREMVANKEITLDEAKSHPQREALISYLGMGGLALLDNNTNPLQLVAGDIILLCSDGLYKALTDKEIKNILLDNAADIEAAADYLTSRAYDISCEKGSDYQDNTSVILIRYEE